MSILTNSVSAYSETIKSDKTDLVDNNDFLRALFGEKLNDSCPLVVSFSGNPTTVPGKKWHGLPWFGDSSFDFVAEANNYFSLAVFQPDDAGQYRRRKSQFQGLCAVMLDDIGSKVSMERLTLPPSWLLETSPVQNRGQNRGQVYL
jgi:hypothetical protein